MSLQGPNMKILLFSLVERWHRKMVARFAFGPTMPWTCLLTCSRKQQCDSSAAFDSAEHSILLRFWSRRSCFKLVRLISFWTNNVYLSVIALLTTSIWTVESPRVIVWDHCIYSLPDVSRFLNIVSQHLPSAHSYADDNQIYLSFRPCSIHSEINAGSGIKKCIAYVRSWFIGNRLMINDSKTDFLIIGTRQQLEKTLNL